MDFVLDLQNVSKHYDRVTAVRDVTMQIREGEFVTFLGPSGSGKTTTLMMIAGLQSPTSGTIRLRNQPIEASPAHKRNIGMVFQHYALFPHMTAAQNIAFPLQMRNVDRAAIALKVAKALDLVGLSNLSDRYPGQMSGGQQQRIALARATVYEPSILLMDEPLGALDKKLREQMQFEIMSLHRKLGISVLYVTHDQEEALVMSDRIAIFNKGEIEQIGAPQALYERPTTAFVANFIGETNLIPGVVSGASHGGALVDTPLGLLVADSLNLTPGRALSVALRPERIDFYATPPEGVDRVVPVTVEEMIYLGQSTKYLVSLPAGFKMTVLHKPRGDQPPLGLGDTVHIGWSNLDLRFLV